MMESVQLPLSDVEDTARGNWLAYFQDAVWEDTPKYSGFVVHMETVSEKLQGQTLRKVPNSNS